jgi:arylsulfatase A-like enzyme
MKILKLLSLVLLVFSSCTTNKEQGAAQNPNIILIVADDLGYGDLGCYGSKLNKTPKLDKMSKEGMLLTDFYSASAMCSPSRASLLTGCYPQRVGFGRLPNQIGHVLLAGEPCGLNPAEITIPEILKTKGYRTKMVGKWHLGDQSQFLPTRQGFDSFFGLPYSHDIAPDHPNRKKFKFPPLPLLSDETVIEKNPDRSQLNQRFTKEAIRFIRNGSSEPFFLYVAFTIPHAPLLPPEEFLKNSDNGPYGAYVELLDYCTGLLLDELKRSGLDENTLVIFSSDHGAALGKIQPGSNGVLRGQKGTTYEGGMRVPGIIQWNGKIEPGSICKKIITQMDLLPTIASITNASLPKDRIYDGKDVSNLFLNPALEVDESVFFYRWMDELHGVRSGRWKLMLKVPFEPIFDKPVLYNLAEDPGEKNNVAEQHPEVVEKLMTLILEGREDLGDVPAGIKGKNNRPLGWIYDAKTLTEFPGSVINK